MNKHTSVKIGTVSSFLLAVPAFVYGLMIYSVHSGSRFFLIWFALAAVFLCSGICSATGLRKRLRGTVKLIFRLAAILAALLVAVTWAMILPHFRDQGEPHADAVIVPGAQVHESGPSTILQYRLDAAVSYLQQNPDTICIVSGGQGPNEPFTEAAGMKEYLLKRGISENRILTEERARTTFENLAFSMQMLPSHDSSVVIITNNFHVFRTLRIADHLGYTHVTGKAAGSSKLFLPNNMLYESAAIVKNTLLGNMN